MKDREYVRATAGENPTSMHAKAVTVTFNDLEVVATRPSSLNNLEEQIEERETDKIIVQRAKACQM